MIEIELTKRAQKRMIDETLKMLEQMCPDWVVYAEPKESYNEAERKANEAQTRPKLVK